MIVVRAKRSLKATSEGIARANVAVLKFATKKEFAKELVIARATVQNFFAGKAINRENFYKICDALKLPWQEIADLELEPDIESAYVIESEPDINVIVQQMRQLHSPLLQQKCGCMRVLDMTQPMALKDIYTNVNILEKINGRRRVEIAELLKESIATSVARPGLGRTNQVPLLGSEAVQKYPKLVVLGKPGAGKTTFLKYVALECDRGKILSDRLPIFISLKDYGEAAPHTSLLTYICELYDSGDNSPTLEQICINGKALILFDGLDEVRENDCYRVLQELRHFTAKYHLNYFILSCRLGTREYTFEEFTEVEVADFNHTQITRFVSRWFAHKDPSLSRKFLNKLQQQNSLQELATNPLLLTLLCLSFEESGDFPENRAELYKEGLSVMLRKWDARRNIERQQIYKKLSVQHKEDLLGQIALQTFERGEYFFRQAQLEQLIAEYIRNIPSVNPEAEHLQIDSEAVLKSIEAQHGLLVERARGIYSFSHLTFQEYFTTKEIIASSDPKALEVGLQNLARRVTQPRWREVFLLSMGMLRNADYLLQLIKQQITQLLADEPQLQSFLSWLDRKSRSVDVSYPFEQVRAFYFDLDLFRMLDIGGSLDLVRSLERNFTRSLDSQLALDLALDRALTLNRVFENTTNNYLARSIHRVLSRAIDRARVAQPNLETALQQLKDQLPRLTLDAQEFKLWWQANGRAWIEQLRAAMIQQRNLGHVWEFNQQQKAALKQYYDANQLLVDCLKSDCYVSSSVRQNIYSTMLLPAKQL